MSRATPRHLRRFAGRCLGLAGYFQSPGDGRRQPRIPAGALLWSQLIGIVLREGSFHGIEALVRSRARTALGVGRRFGDDSLAYFTQRLDAEVTRAALGRAVARAKRNKAFECSRFIGLALDGTTVGRAHQRRCVLCRAVRDARHTLVGYHHQFSAIGVVGTGLTLPLDIEPYGPWDSEYAASQRLLRRVVERLGRGFADYVVVDGEYATSSFLHVVRKLRMHVVARVKGNLRKLQAAAAARFEATAPCLVVQQGHDRVELWDAEDFQPWLALCWPRVRVLRYRQHKPDGTVVEAYWLTDFSIAKVGSLSLYRLAKSRWEIENEVFNDGKNRYGLEHITHHHANSLLLQWLLTGLALTIERLYRLRHLHRGTHRVYSPIELVRLLRLSLAAPLPHDTS